MDVLLYVLGLSCVVVGAAGAVLPLLPGAPLVFAGIVLVAWAGNFERIGWATLAVCGVLTLLAMAADFAASLVGARRLGASRWGAAGAAVGLVAGLPFGLPGLVLGPAVGAVALEYAKDREARKAARAGFGAFVGFAVGLILKTAIVFVMIGWAAAVWLASGGG